MVSFSVCWSAGWSARISHKLSNFGLKLKSKSEVRRQFRLQVTDYGFKCGDNYNDRNGTSTPLSDLSIPNANNILNPFEIFGMGLRLTGKIEIGSVFSELP